VTIERPDGSFGHESETELSCDATHFRLTARLSVTENGTPVFTRSWDERIARDHL
jgi:uncharacterized protein